MKKSLKKSFSFLMVVVIIFSAISCGNKNANSKGDVYILNFGDYLADEAIEIFESETGLRVDVEKNLLLVKGAVPGPKKALVTIKESVKA